MLHMTRFSLRRRSTNAVGLGHTTVEPSTGELLRVCLPLGSELDSLLVALGVHGGLANPFTVDQSSRKHPWSLQMDLVTNCNSIGVSSVCLPVFTRVGASVSRSLVVMIFPFQQTIWVFHQTIYVLRQMKASIIVLCQVHL